jgi:hypothetical protein
VAQDRFDLRWGRKAGPGEVSPILICLFWIEGWLVKFNFFHERE